jgi:hypothetical protein
MNGQATPLSFAALESRAFGDGSAKGTFADAAPLSSQSRNALPSGAICQPKLSRKTQPLTKYVETGGTGG